MPYIICIFCLYYLIEYQCNLRVKRTLKRLRILIYQSCLNKRSKFIEKKLKDQDWRQLLFELKFLVPSIITPKPRPKICEITGFFFLRKPFLLFFFLLFLPALVGLAGAAANILLFLSKWYPESRYLDAESYSLILDLFWLLQFHQFECGRRNLVKVDVIFIFAIFILFFVTGFQQIFVLQRNINCCYSA